jgi:hypothetical protein
MDNQPKPSNLPADLLINPDGTATFTLNEEGDVLGTYKGTFVFKCFLNPLEVLAAGKVYRELIGSNPQDATDTERFMAFALSQLSKRIIKSPPFWNTGEAMTGNIPDVNVLSLILDRAVTAELAYKERLKIKREEALETAKIAATAIQESFSGVAKEPEEAPKRKKK